MISAIRKIETAPNLTAQAYESIKTLILREDLDETTRLTEEMLSTQLGISKSPVREALHSLHTEGLIRIEARRGAFLRSFTAKEVKDLYELREALEIFAIRTSKVTPQLIHDLRESVRRTREDIESSDRIAHIAEDTHFHNLIAASTGNGELCRVLTNIQNQLWICRRRTFALTSSTAPDAHTTILNALAGDDRDAAVEAMHQHLKLVRERLLRFMEERDTVEY